MQRLRQRLVTDEILGQGRHSPDKRVLGRGHGFLATFSRRRNLLSQVPDDDKRLLVRLQGRAASAPIATIPAKRSSWQDQRMSEPVTPLPSAKAFGEDEHSVLLGYLRYHRTILARKLEG